MALRHHKLFIHDHISGREHSEVYVSEKAERGELFILLELPRNKINQQHIVDRIINAGATYFETNQNVDSESLLEEILQELNKILPEISAALKIKGWLNSLDLAVGIISGNNVYLSGLGNINAVLFSHGKATPLLEKNQIINVNKIFSDIISGTLEDGDALIISTNSIFDYISLEKIKQIVKKYSPGAIVAQIQRLLESVPDFVTFNSLFIKKPALADVELAPRPASGQMHDTEARGDIVSSPKPSGGHHMPGARTKTVVDLSVLKDTKPVRTANNIWQYFKIFFSIVAKVSTKVYRACLRAVKYIFVKKHRQAEENVSMEKMERSVTKKIYLFQKLTTKKKIAVVAVFIIALLFIQSLVFLSQQKFEEKKYGAYNQTLVEIDNLFAEADSKLIYNDEEEAENILLQILEKIKNTPVANAEQQAELDSLIEKTNHQLNKVRHINEVASPLEIYDLSSTLLSARQIVQKEGKFYILDQNQLFVLENSQLRKLVDFSDGNLLTDWPDQNKLVLGSGENYYIFDITAEQLESYTLTKASGNSSIKDAAIYGDNMYVLDHENNQIYKYPERAEAFGAGFAWLTSAQDLANSSNLTIDGDIYVIFNDGIVKKYSKGEAVAFEQRSPRPAIGSNSIIKTFRDSDFLYIIDPTNRRVIIMGKDGSIKDQYTSDKFDQLTDLAIDPEEKAIYLLNGSHLYLLAINQ